MLPEFSDPLLHAELADAGIHRLKPVAPLCMGTSNQNFLATSQGESWVLRVNSQHTTDLCPREREVACWRLAAAAGLAPELRFVSGDYRYYLSRYLHTEPPWHKRYPSDLKTVRMLHELLTSLQYLPKTTRVITPAKQWQQYQQLLAQYAPNFDAHQRDAFNALMAHADTIAGAIAGLQDSQELSFCHRDLNPHNLLIHQDRLVCIDFEYSCVSDRRVDLATLLACHKLSDDQARRLLQLQSFNANARELVWAKRIYWAYAACWSLLMWHKGVGSPNWIRDALIQLQA